MNDDSLSDVQKINAEYDDSFAKDGAKIGDVGINIKPLMAGSGNDSVLAREIWNKAIEACAAEVGKEGWLMAQYLIRKLKK